jgi:hypothetical protein
LELLPSKWKKEYYFEGAIITIVGLITVIFKLLLLDE